jgi:enoyl-CoA hydratase/carnithine racemase
MTDEIQVATDDHVCTVTLNRPAKRNALSSVMIRRLHAELTRIGTDPAVRVIVLRATGPAFCAGLDLREMAAQRAAGEASLTPLEEILECLEACPQPTIAAVQGDALAGGCELALHCDLRVAAETARFGMPLARIGLAVPIVLVWKLVDAIGASKTAELLFTGEPISAEEALRLNLVNRVVPGAGLDSVVAALARQIADNAPLAVRTMKAAIHRASSFRRTIPRDDLEAMARQVRSSHDLQEGLAAQRERRAPRFTGT